jgi:hypothetical protein
VEGRKAKGEIHHGGAEKREDRYAESDERNQSYQRKTWEVDSE